MALPEREKARSAGPGRFERFLLAFMGPAQLGDLDSPSTLPADPQRDLCPKCAQPWEAHQIIRPSSLTLALCPDGTAQQQ